jgi:uncharacterized protein YndB with AHSA1/START domain
MTPDTSADDRVTGEVTVVRVFDAPRESVWDAWTKPELFARWFFTPPFETPPSTVHMDVRPGGRWGATQVSESEDIELPFLGTYREVEPPDRLVLTFENPADRADPNVEVLTLTFRAVSSGTELTLRQVGHLPADQYPKLAEGYSRFFDNLAEMLGGVRAG